MRSSMNISKRLRHRLVWHHLSLALVCAFCLPLLTIGLLDGTAMFRWSMATAYMALALLAITLCIGPWHVLSSRRSPLSMDLRRDFGIWAGLLSLAHVAIGLQVHLGSMVLYFFVKAANGQWALRVDPFGLTNWVGLLAALVFVLLLALSNDWSLRRVGRARWKTLQRFVYPAAMLVVLHGAVYEVLEKRNPGWVLVFISTVMLVVLVQCLGFRRLRTQLPPSA